MLILSLSTSSSEIAKCDGFLFYNVIPVSCAVDKGKLF